MAILRASSSSDGPITGWPLGDAVTQPGQYVAVCLDVKDSLGIERPTFDDPNVMETVDLTRFLFGLQDGSMIQTGEMKITGHERSNLVKFLTGWLGRPPQMDGSWDYCEMIGQGAVLSVAQKVSRKGRTYADVQGVTPVMEQLAEQVPQAGQFTVPEASTPPVQAQAQPVAQPQPAPVVQPQVQQAQPIIQPPAATTTTGNIFTPVETDPDF